PTGPKPRTGSLLRSMDLETVTLDDALRLLSRENTLGQGPCHLCLDPDEAYLIVANYFSGGISVFPVTENGLGPIVQHAQHEGKSVHPTRQAGPHAHHVSFIPGTRLLCCVDLGLDAVLVYRQDPATGRLALNDRLDVAPGLGPRHLAYGKAPYAYLAHEIGSQVSVLLRRADCWETLQTLPTLPPDFEGESTVAAVRLSEDGRLLLVSNRGHDSIAFYDIGSDGLLTLRGIHATGGGIPRDFALLPGGRMLIGHQAGQVHLAAWDADSGIQTLDILDVAGAVCVCPAD
ncbi:MAG TPA: beta-propeller fold lactonase family protein, partial [Clostridia bacterium]|nr:beta-propeller fold lactonase family protein [Clostridia bacterium]